MSADRVIRIEELRLICLQQGGIEAAFNHALLLIATIEGDRDKVVRERDASRLDLAAAKQAIKELNSEIQEMSDYDKETTWRQKKR